MRGRDDSSKLLMAKGFGGRDRDRTGDPLLAKQVLSQLSYTPTRYNHYTLNRLQRVFLNMWFGFFVPVDPKLKFRLQTGST